MKSAIIAALIGALAVGGALGAFAATRTVETTAGVDVRVWQRVSDGELYISTRPEGAGNEAWVTSAALDMSNRSRSGNFYLSPQVTVSVPVLVDVDVPDAVAATPIPQQIPKPVPGTCCQVQGMPDDTDARDGVVAIVEEVIEFAEDTYGFTHSGGITIHIAHTIGGLYVRYEEAFGERPASLPNSCAFQDGEHLFIGPLCRTDRAAIAAEWLRLSYGTPDFEPSWLSDFAHEYFTTHFGGGTPPSIGEHRFRSTLFFERPTDLRRARASEDMRELAFVYLVREVGDYSDWVRFHRHIEAGWDVDTAFLEVFDIALPDFYSIFEEWADYQKILLVASAYGSCTEAYLNIAGYRGGFPDYRVPLETDHDYDGVVCEGFGAQR